MTGTKATVLVVEDEEKILDVVVSYLEKSGYRVMPASGGKTALELFSKEEPDCVILDLMLPDIPGEAVCETIRRKSRVPVLMLTAKAGETSILAGFGSGADDYLTKPFSPRELVARVTALVRRNAAGNMPLVNVLRYDDGLEIDVKNRSVKKNNISLKLTHHEYGILVALASYPGKIFSREELIKSAFDSDFSGFDRTIDAHIKNLRRKIEADPRCPVHIITVHGLGYRFDGA